MSSIQSGSIGVIGGSGVYDMEGLVDVSRVDVETPFGAPSDSFVSGLCDGRPVFFLPRHGRGHRLLPHELNVRANIWAFKKLGVDWILSISAVGSLKESIRPRDVVIPSQLFDRTRVRPSTFFGDGIAAHVSMAEPFCPVLRAALIESCRRLDLPLHENGTYVCIEGPAFSTRAESEVNRKMDFDVVGMTALPEARLAREAEIAYATVALSTDYDVWHESGEVSVEMVLQNLHANTENVKKIIRSVFAAIPSERTSPAHRALDGAVMTDRTLWPVDTVERLAPILARLKEAA